LLSRCADGSDRTGAGIVGALILTRLLSKLLFGVTTKDPATFIAILGLLSLVALLACYVPAWRATKVDPLEALRCGSNL
jgi:putative ABC transport system permease protein